MAAGGLSPVLTEWSNRNGLSVQVRPEYAAMCRTPLEVSLWNGFPLTISDETPQEQGRQPADRHCQIAPKADSMEATGVAVSLSSPCPQGRMIAEPGKETEKLGAEVRDVVKICEFYGS